MNLISATRLFVAALFSLALLTGCAPTEATVTGKVTLDGQPLAKGIVSFYSPGANALAMGAIDPNGNYKVQTGTAEGLKPGTYQVTVVATDTIEPTQPFASPSPKLLTPPKYSSGSTSGLTAEVKPGPNTHNFDLQSMPD